MFDEQKESLFLTFCGMADDSFYRTRFNQLKVISELQDRPAIEFVSDIFRERLAAQMRSDGLMTEAEIQSHLYDKCEKMKAIEIAEKKREYGLDVEENPEIVQQKAIEKMIAQAKKLNEGNTE